MKIKILNEDASSWSEAFGMTNERMLELKALIEATVVPGNNELDSIRIASEECNTVEELVFVTFQLGRFSMDHDIKAARQQKANKLFARDDGKDKIVN